MKKLLSFLMILCTVFAVQAQTTITDDFESYADFTINPTGQWTFLDLDADSTYGFSGITFPNNYSPMAFIVFNPTQTDPELTSMIPHSGDKVLACIASTGAQNNDWIISPDLGTHTGCVFSFWAMAFDGQYPEWMKVGYSTTTNESSAFTFIQGGSHVVVPNEWTKYTYILPADAKYVAINCISDDAFIFMLDDISIEFPTDPTLYLSTDQIDFGSLVVGNERTKTATISSVNLTDDITVTTAAPFEVSTDGTTFSSTATLTTSGTLHVKFSPTVAGTTTGIITLNSTGLTEDTISLTGYAVECNPVTEFPYSCGFESSEETTLCWYFIDVDGNGNQGADEFGFALTNDGDTWLAYFHSGESAEPTANDWAISPEFTIPENHYGSFDFMVGQYFIAFPETFSVWALVDGADIEDAVNLVPSRTYENASPAKMRFDLSDYANQTIRIGIKVETSSTQGYYLAIDNFEIKPIVSEIELLSETSLEFGACRIGSVFQQTASFIGVNISDPITVTATGEFKVSLDGTTFTSSISIPGDDEFTFERDFYIQFAPTSAGNKTGTVTIASAVLDEDIEIAVSGIGVDCSTISSFPYAADFTNEYPCWTVKDDNNDGKSFLFGTGFAAYVYSSSNAANDWLISPEINITDAELTVQVAYSCQSATFPERFSVWVITDINNHTGGTKIIGPVDVSNTEIGYTNFAELRSYVGQTVHIGIKAESNADMYYLYIDGVTIQQGVGIDKPSVDNYSVNVYPNPTSSVLTIESTSAINQIELYNMTGQLVYKMQGNDSRMTLNTNDLPQGFYFVRVYNENGLTVKKVSVIK